MACIGLDWADERHSVHLQAADGTIEHFELEQKPDVLHEWVAQLQQRFGGGKIAVALEQRKGAVIHALLMYDCFVLYPINPKALARYREAFRTSGAKDDPLDSELLLDLVVRHRDQLRAWVPDTVESRTLQALCEQRRKLVNHRVALTNRLTSLLKQYFPQALDWVGDVASVQACDFLDAVADARRRATRAAQYAPEVLSRAQLSQGRRHRGAPGGDRQRASAHHRCGDHRAPQPLGPDLRDATARADRGDPDVRRTHRRRCLPRMPITTSSPVFLAPATSARRAWRPPLAPTAPAGTPPPSCNPTRALRPSPNGVAKRLGPSSAGLSEIRQADLSRIRGPIDSLFPLGARVLRPAAGARQRSSRGATSARLQMDPDSVSLLEGWETVRRSDLHRRASPTRVTAREKFCLTAQLRCPSRPPR